MIISHQHRYLFVELPRTGSTAISRELRQNYDGESILVKHATYQISKDGDSGGERVLCLFRYRNPLDDAVSLYFNT